MVALVAVATSIGCSKPVVEPLQLQGNRLTVDNQTSDDWRDVEIWLNSYFRITVPSIPSRRRFQAPLDAFVSGYGQRFNFSRMQITALRLSGKRPDGSPVEVQKQFQESGLAGALGVKR
jgi:hypothetical protein